MLTASPRCYELIKRFESLRLTAYLCPAGVPTIGWGHTRTVTRADVGLKRITPEQADALLVADVMEREPLVNERVRVPITQQQFDALVSFVFNIRNPTWTFREVNCTLLRKLNAGDYSGAAEEFLRWNKATDPHTGTSVALRGLTARRAAEAQLFRGV